MQVLNKLLWNILYHHELSIYWKLLIEQLKEIRLSQWIFMASLLVLILVVLGWYRFKWRMTTSSWLVTHYPDIKSEEDEAIFKLNNSVQYNLQQRISEDTRLFIEKKLEELIHAKFFLSPYVSLNKLAREIGTNRSYLAIVIQRRYRKKFLDFVNDLRVKEALLLFRKNSVSDQSELWKYMGFKSQITFFRAFKKHTGITYKAFVKSLRRK